MSTIIKRLERPTQKMMLVSTAITFTLVFFSSSECLSWSRVEAAQVQTKTICRGDNVVLSEPIPQVMPHHVFVYRNGETMASTSVASTGDLQGRLLVGDDTRVMLNNLSSSDLGMYRVEVKLSDEKAIERSMRLVVGEPPDTINGTLFVTSHFLNDTFLRLQCGNFISLGYPPVSVIWKDPTEKLLASTGFSAQFFTLDLPIKMARSGIYCCQLDCREPNYCCLDNQSPLRQCVKVAVQTGRRDEDDSGMKQDGVPLVNFIDLVQRVSDIDVIVRELERIRTLENCSQSCVTFALAPLVRRQEKCEQLEVDLERLKVEQKFEKDLQDISKITTDLTAQLRQVTRNIQDVRSEMEDSVQQVNKSLNDHVSQTAAKITDTGRMVQEALFRLPQLDQQMRELQEKMRNDSTRISHDLEDLRRNTSQQTTAMKDSMRDTENGLLARIKSLNKTFEGHRLETEKKMTNITDMLQKVLSKQQEADEWMVKVDDWRSRASNDLFQITSKLTRTGQDAHDEKARRDREMSAMKTQTTNIESALQAKVNREEIRGDLEKLKVKRCESGHLAFMPNSQASVQQGAYPFRIHKIHVSFAQPFATQPWISLGISHLDSYNTANLRVNLKALSISTSGFDGQALEWDNTRVVRVEAYWIACTF